MRKAWMLFILFLFFSSTYLAAIQFRYTYSQGDQYRFVSRVYQEHGFDGEPLQKDQLVNRMTFQVAQVKDGRGQLVGGQQTSQQVPGQDDAALWSKEYPISFWRDTVGVYEVASDLFVPMVRNVPFFPPDRDLKPGDKWFGKGEEVHDMTKQIGYPKPFRIPIIVEHEYVGPITEKGKVYHHIKVTYRYSQFIPAAFVTNAKKGDAVAQRLRGNFEQDIYWDEELGQPAFYKEKYQISLDFDNRRTYIFKGEAEANLIEAKPMNKQQVENDVRQQLAQEGLSDIKVRRTERGVTLSVDIIQFVADSAALLPGQDEKLAKIGTIVKGYKDRDIAVVGHTARIGNDPNEGQHLSELRAKTIADFLAKNQYKESESLIVEGRGARDPLGDNGTEQGRAKNRRVEITILEN